MSLRTLFILAGLVAVAALAVWFTHADREGEVAGVGDRFLPGLLAELNDVDSITVRIAGGDTLAELGRDEAGEWRVRTRWGYPADLAAVRGTLIALAEARTAEARTADPERWPRLGVGDIERAGAEGMELVLAHPAGPTRVLIGRAGPGGEGSYARVAGGDRAWLLDQRIERRTRVSQWLESHLLDVPVDEVVAVDIRAVAGEPVRVRRDRGSVHGFRIEDVPEEATLLTPSIARSLARVVTDLAFSDVRPLAEAGPLEPVAEARYETRDGLVIRIDTHTLPAFDDLEVARLDAGVTAAAGSETRARAEALSAAWDGWVYRLPEHKFVNASHHLGRIIDIPAGSR